MISLNDLTALNVLTALDDLTTLAVICKVVFECKTVPPQLPSTPPQASFTGSLPSSQYVIILWFFTGSSLHMVVFTS